MCRPDMIRRAFHVMGEMKDKRTRVCIPDFDEVLCIVMANM